MYFEKVKMPFRKDFFLYCSEKQPEKPLQEMLKVVKANEPIYNASTILAGEYEFI
jgi:hypothetical protein